MIQQMAMINKRSDYRGIAEVHAQFDAGIRPLPTPVVHTHGIAQVRLIHRRTVRLQQQEVQLMDVKCVQL